MMGTEASSTEAQKTLRVVVADDHVPYRQGLTAFLAEHGIEVVGEASDGRGALDAVELTAPDVVVMDLKMPGMSGIEATRRLTRREPACPVLVVTLSADESDVTDAVLAGASGYVLKDSSMSEVEAGIRAVASGESPISAQVASVPRRSPRR